MKELILGIQDNVENKRVIKPRKKDEPRLSTRMQDFSIKTLGLDYTSPSQMNGIKINIHKKESSLPENVHQRALKMRILEKKAKLLFNDPTQPIIMLP